jgi:primosomal replication protein N
MTINQQPGGTIYALSPVIYHISDSAYNEANFRYKLEVYIWSGDNPSDKPGTATYTLTKLPDSNNVGIFDISQLIRSQLGFEEPDALLNANSTQVNNNTTGAVWVQVTATYTSDDSTATPVDSGTRLAVRGFTKYSQGVNSTHSSRATMSNFIDGLVIPNSLQFTTSFLTATIDNLVIEGEHGIDYAIDMTGKDTTETTESLVHVLLGSDLYGQTLEKRRQDIIADSGTIESFSCVYSYATQYNDTYTIVAKDGAAEQRRMSVEVACADRYTQFFIGFLNRFGAYDYIPALKAREDSATFERREFDNSYLTTAALAVSYTDTEGTERIFEANGQESITINTGYQPEGIWEMITDMMQSEKVFLVDGTNIVPLIPSSGDVAKQKHINNKLVNYTLAFRVANDLKNMVTI